MNERKADQIATATRLMLEAMAREEREKDVEDLRRSMEIING